MDNNSLLTGKIGGNCKTYEESYFVIADEYEIERLDRKKNGYIDKYGELFFKEEGYRTPVTILNIIPYFSNENGKTRFIVEVIDRNILLQHLEQEKMIVEKILSSEMGASYGK